MAKKALKSKRAAASKRKKKALKSKRAVASKRKKKASTKALRMATSRGKTRVTIIVDPFPGDDPWEWPKGQRSRRT